MRKKRSHNLRTIMCRKGSSNIFGFFVLIMSVCLLYAYQLKTLKGLGDFEGLTCPDAEIVFKLNNMRSDIQCAFHCLHKSMCVALFLNLPMKTCVGCRTLKKKELVSEVGSIMYAQVVCGDPPSIAYGTVTLNSGRNIMDTASVACDPRFRASSHKITCMANRVWETATCEEYDCFVTTPREYKGKRNKSNAGYPCLRWDSAEVVSFGHTDTDKYPESTLSEAENFCRSPESKYATPWCYGKNDFNDVYITYCDIYKCT